MQTHSAYPDYDYKPLLHYLLSKVGCDWTIILNNVRPRINNIEVLDWFVEDSYEKCVSKVTRVGEKSYFPTMYVDEHRKLQIYAPEITIDDLAPSCKCCTHTFKGEEFTVKWNYNLHHSIVIEEKDKHLREFKTNGT